MAGAAYGIVTDQLGTPLSMYDAKSAEAWGAELGIYGHLRRLKGPRQLCPFRWPGQHEDVETGLYYNRFRYSDPVAGAYVSQDPIRLRGSAAFYGYPLDPLVGLDPAGLAAIFRGDDNYPGGPIGIPLGENAEIETPWEHVRRESTQSSVFTSFSDTNSGAKKSTKGNNIYKVEMDDIRALEQGGKIQVLTPDDVFTEMKASADKKVCRDASNVKAIMDKNKEVLISTTASKLG